MTIKLEINLTNRWLYFLMAFGILLILGVGVYAYTQSIPNPGHSGDTILVTVGGTEMTLQEALNSPPCTLCQTCGGNWPNKQGKGDWIAHGNMQSRGLLCSGVPTQSYWTNQYYLCCR